MSRIFIAVPSGEPREYDEDELRLLWQQGYVERNSLYWKGGMTEWKSLSEYLSVWPQAESVEPPPAFERPCEFTYAKDPYALTSFLVVMLWITLGFEVITMVSELAEYALLGRELNEAEGLVNEVRQALVGLAYLVVFLITGVTFLRWIHRANLNARGFGAEDMRFTPGWAVSHYFIPIVCLFRPYQVMKEIWQVSQNPRDWQSQAGSPLLVSWWALWLLWGFVSQASYRLWTSAETIPQYQTSSLLSMLSSVIGVALCIVAVKLVMGIARNQQALVEEREASLVSGTL
jgi:hypothetical protein